MADQKYFLDTNIFISSYRGFYAMDIVPSFWEALSETALKTGRIYIPDMIKEEVLRNEDGLTNWLRENISSFKETLSSAEDVQKSFTKIADWTNSADQFTENAKKTFLSCADPWIVAHTMTYGGKVVTMEVSAPESKRKIKIPDVCMQFKVPYITLYSFMKELKICI
jgi:predicted nucleic acid-binding protein